MSLAEELIEILERATREGLYEVYYAPICPTCGSITHFISSRRHYEFLIIPWDQHVLSDIQGFWCPVCET